MRSEVTVNDQTFRIGERVRIGKYVGELIEIHDFDMVTVDVGEELDDGYNDGFANVHPSQLKKLAATDGGGAV